MSSAPAHRPSRRAHILQAALRAFGQNSLARGLPTMGSIASHAGVTTAALYYHFSSRADLMVTLMTQIHPQVLGMFEKATPDGRTTAWVTELCAEVAGWAVEEPDAARFYFLAPAAPPDSELAACCDHCRDEVLDTLRRHVQRHRPELTEVIAWVYAHALREVIVTAVELGLRERTHPPRGFPALRTAAAGLVVDLLSDTAPPVL